MIDLIFLIVRRVSIILNFSNDCIIKLGKNILYSQLYNIFLYFQICKKILYKDIMCIIFNYFLKNISIF